MRTLTRKPSPLPPPRAVPAPAHRVHPAGQTPSASVSQVLASPGRPLDPAQQQDMRQRFGHDFSRVRVHADAAAEQSAWAVNANAYTVGRHMVFAPGKYAPHTSDGKRLLAHELVHTLQQRDAPAAVPGPLRVSAPNDSHEAEADHIARGLSRDAAVDTRAPVRVTSTGAQVAREPARDGMASVLLFRLDHVKNLLRSSGKELTLIGLVSDGVVIEIKVQDGSSRLFGVSNPWVTERDDRFGHVPTTTMYRATNRWVIDYLGEGPGTNVTGRRIVLNAEQTTGEMALALYLEGQKRVWQGQDSYALEASVKRADHAQARADYVKAKVNDVVQRNVEQIDVKDALKKQGAEITTPLLLEGEYNRAFVQGLNEEITKRGVGTAYGAGRAAGARVFEDALKSGRLLTHTGDKYADYHGKEWDKRHEEWVRQHPEVVKEQQFDAWVAAVVELVNKTDPKDPVADKVIELIDSIVPLLNGAGKTNFFVGKANDGLERLLGPFGFRTVLGVAVAGLQLDRLEYALGNFAAMGKEERDQLRRNPFAAGRKGIQMWPTAAEREAEGRLVAIRTLPDGSTHVGPLSEFREAVEQNRINHALGQLEAIRSSGPASLFGRIVGGEKGAAIGAMVDAGLMMRGTMKARQAVRTQMRDMGSGGHVVTRAPLDARIERAQPRTPVPKPDLPTQTVKAPPATTLPPAKVTPPPAKVTPTPPKTETPKTETPTAKPPTAKPPKTETPKTEPPKTETPKTETPPVKPPYPAHEFPAEDMGWQQWPPPKESAKKPVYDEPGGARFRYDRYRYQQWLDSGKSATPPKKLKGPKQYFDEHVAPKAVGQSPGEFGSPEHKELLLKVRIDNNIGTQTMGSQRPDAVGNVNQTLKVGNQTFTPEKGGRVLYEAENFYKDGSQMVSKGREQVRQFRKDNPNATIVVQDVANPNNIVVYKPGTQPPPGGHLKPGTTNLEPAE